MINRDELLKELKEQQQERRFRKIVRALLENYLSEKKTKICCSQKKSKGL